MKPNSLFPGMQGKRAIVLKPNGLFSLTKKSEAATPAVYYDYEYNDGPQPYWGMPHGLFGFYKRAEDMSDDEIDDDILEYGDDNEEKNNDIDSEAVDEIIDIETPQKRDNNMFWATRGKKEDGTFWATRGKKSDDFWAVRG